MVAFLSPAFAPAWADASGAADAASPQREVAVGAEVDLLPPVLSATQGALGASGQLWAGTGHFRLRLVGAHLRLPDSLAGVAAGFHGQETTVAALLLDGFFLDRFEGPWLGAGFEFWWSSVGSTAGPLRASWNVPVLTAGGGYVFTIWGDLYLNPWAAVHWTTSPREVDLVGLMYSPRRFSAEVSLKVGWNLWL